MTKAVCGYILLTFFLCLSSIYAQSSGSQTANISVNASVADTLDFTWNIHRLVGEESPWAGKPDQAEINFEGIGELDPLKHQRVMFSDLWYCMFLWVTANKPYHIKQTAQSLMTADGKHNLDNSFIVTPDYNENDKWNGVIRQGPIGKDKLGSPCLVKNADILYYGNDGKSHIIRLYYAIPAKSAITGWKPILNSQFNGKYQSSITITITPQSP